MSRLVILGSEVNPKIRGSRRETESEQGVQLSGIDAKLSDLPLARVKAG